MLEKRCAIFLAVDPIWHPKLKSPLGDNEKSFLAQCDAQAEIAKERKKKPGEEWGNGHFQAEGSFQLQGVVTCIPVRQ